MDSKASDQIDATAVRTSRDRIGILGGGGDDWEVLRGLDFVYAYNDNLVVATSGATEREVRLRKLFERLDSFGVEINATKREFGVPSLIFLGHEMNSEGIKPVPEKVSAISTFPVSTTINQVRRFWAIKNYYHRFLPHGSTILQQLHSLLAHPKKTMVMTEETVKSLNDVKAALARATLLAHSRADARLTIMTDTSSTAVGASLQQTAGGVLQPLAFFSKKLSPSETRHSVFGRERLTVYLPIHPALPTLSRGSEICRSNRSQATHFCTEDLSRSIPAP
ncbi:hypothetical protein SprV_0401562100 [Sparganum proliferum]